MQARTSKLGRLIMNTPRAAQALKDAINTNIEKFRNGEQVPVKLVLMKNNRPVERKFKVERVGIKDREF